MFLQALDLGTVLPGFLIVSLRVWGLVLSVAMVGFTDDIASMALIAPEPKPSMQ